MPQGGRGGLTLALPGGLLDPHRRVDPLAAAARLGGAERRGTERVEADGDAHVGVVGALIAHGVKGDPA